MVKNLPNNVGEAGSIPGLRRSPGGRNGNLLQYPHLEIHGQKSLAGYSPFYSVTKSYLTLCDPMDCCTPGFPVLHRLPEFAQTHIHRVSDAIQPSHPLSSPSSPIFNLSQHHSLSQEVSSSHQVAKVLESELQHQSFQ